MRMSEAEKHDREVYVNDVYKKNGIWYAEVDVCDTYDDERETTRRDMVFEYDDMFNADSEEVIDRACCDAEDA